MISEERLISMYRRVYSMPTFVRILEILGALSVFYVAGAFIYGIAVLLFEGMYLYALKLLLMAAIPFAAVTLMRLLVNSKRPYEVFEIPEFDKMREERKTGKSFPSRHVFSAFLIGTLLLPFGIFFGIAAIILGAFLALERVLLGIHFVKDALVGAIVGVLTGIVGILIL